MTPDLLVWFKIVSSMFNLPSGLMESMCYVESRFQPNAIHYDDGGGDSLGLCQLHLATARFLGFQGTDKDLTSQPMVNIYYSARYVDYQLHRYHGNLVRAIAAYNSGTCRLVKGKIRNHRYVEHVLKVWETREYDRI